MSRAPPVAVPCAAGHPLPAGMPAGAVGRRLPRRSTGIPVTARSCCPFPQPPSGVQGCATLKNWPMHHAGAIPDRDILGSANSSSVGLPTGPRMPKRPVSPGTERRRAGTFACDSSANPVSGRTVGSGSGRLAASGSLPAAAVLSTGPAVRAREVGKCPRAFGLSPGRAAAALCGPAADRRPGRGGRLGPRLPARRHPLPGGLPQRSSARVPTFPRLSGSGGMQGGRSAPLPGLEARDEPAGRSRSRSRAAAGRPSPGLCEHGAAFRGFPAASRHSGPCLQGSGLRLRQDPPV